MATVAGNNNVWKWALLAVSLAINIALGVGLSMSGARAKAIEANTERSIVNDRNIAVINSKLDTLIRDVQMIKEAVR